MAGPLFTAAERIFNSDLRDALARLLPEVEFVLPQEASDALLPDLEAVAADCFEHVRECDLVLANLDGPDADSGTCVEVGFAIGLGKHVIGFRTDFRAGEVDGVNAMLRYGCNEIVSAPSFSGGIMELARAIAERIGRLKAPMSPEPTEIVRYRLAGDGDDRTYVIPVGRGREFAAICEAISKFWDGGMTGDPPEIPEWAVEVENPFGRLTFSDWRVED
ncbi:nucleoside 2-deoxyribosyltransferase [Methylosinus sp. PW1]|uniref:nucleoside 2-deoxyribosyltransferase n=1 Tax=Methylosinus sp. PW1 TaxID=107636 RepID=UPI000ADA0CB9|nr:nucleoside 2-deoxyribosyltransferase [Methylosinus sp. PW1]